MMSQDRDRFHTYLGAVSVVHKGTPQLPFLFQLLFPVAPRGGELALQKLGRRLKGSHPGAVSQESVDLIGKNQLLEVNSLPSQGRRQIDRLAEGDIAVIVSVDQKNRRSPGADRSHG